MSHSQQQPGSLPKNAVSKTTANPPDQNAAPEKSVVDANQGSLELGKHRIGEKVAHAPAPEKYVTPTSGEKFPFPTGQVSADKETSRAAAQADTERNHHANPSRNSFAADDQASPASQAAASAQPKAAPTTHPAFPIKQPSKTRNGS